MKKIPVVIDKCEDCPYVNYTKGLGSANLVSYYCRKTFKWLDIATFHGPIPDWCPLEDQPESKQGLFAELGKKVDEVMKKNMGTRDIITWYMRRNRNAR